MVLATGLLGHQGARNHAVVDQEGQVLEVVQFSVFVLPAQHAVGLDLPLGRGAGRASLIAPRLTWPANGRCGEF